MKLASFPKGTLAVVIGASGGIGSALANKIDRSGQFDRVLRMSRDGEIACDVESEASVGEAAHRAHSSGEIRLVLVATGLLHDASLAPEKSWRSLDKVQLTRMFAVNAIGPALLMKHFLPLLPKNGKSVFAAISARLAAIGDNRLGGWYGYRASKAALNQIVPTAAIELARTKPDAICAALHPGTAPPG